MDSTHTIATFVAFSTAGTIGVAQEIAGSVLDGVEDANPELVAEESLCLVCVVAARAAAFGFKTEPALAAAAETTLLDLPFTWRDYHVAGAILDNDGKAPPDEASDLYDRLGRKLQFYTSHLPKGEMPGKLSLTDKMALWMGRVSPPGLHEMPDQRLARLGLVNTVVRHARLLREFALSVSAT